MNDPIAATSLARLTPRQARWVLAAVLLAVLFCVAITLSPIRSGYADGPARGHSDIELYRAEIDRMAAGEGYYKVAADELVQRGYPTASVFNWRTPLPMWLIAQLPSPVLGKALLGLLALSVLLVGFEAVARGAGAGRAVLTSLLLTGGLLLCVLGDVYAMPVVWAGVLIALSLCCYGVNHPRLAVAMGLAAVFCRDLAVPYGVLCFAMAIRNQRRGEILGWAAGLAAYVLYFGVHAFYVAQARPLVGIAHVGSWLQLGGAPFVISTAQVNAYLLLLPQWVAAVFLSLALLGVAGWRGEFGQRVALTLAMYVVAFAFVGHDFNQYWGALIAPLLCFGAAQAPATLSDLWRAARGTARASSAVASV